MRKLLLLLLWLGWSCGPSVAQEPAAPVCRTCTSTGLVPCSKHAKLLPREQPTADCLQCSVATECKACAGALAVDCKQCEHPGAAGELQRRQELARQWLDERRQKIDALTKREPFLHLRSTNFDVVSALKAATVGKDKVDPHVRLHLFAERLEALRVLFLQTFELPPTDLRERHLVCLSDEAKDHAVLGPQLTGMGTANSVGLKLMGPQYVYSMWQDRRSLPDDEAVHRNVVHHVTHLLLSEMPPGLFLGNKKLGWIDEGVAHWFEDKVVGKCTNFCFEEVLLLAGAGFQGGKWRPAVRKLVDEGKAPTFASVAVRNTDELTFVEHAFAFAYVDFLLTAHGGAKFRDLVRLCKRDQPLREALHSVYGWSVLSFDEVFLTWVKANYSALPAR
ncbi:MAG: hypothetical protein MUC36_05205 [Planctomycetes bacterium]|jgi:hypothetical protein|nr:hypothetical protein [Planctomycetota bacterium]